MNWPGLRRRASRLAARLALVSLVVGAPGAHAAPGATVGAARFVAIDDGGAIRDGVVAAIAQDRAGFIWVGSVDGVSRFDGYHFRHYGFGAPVALQKRTSFIVALAPDKKGRVWVGTDGDGLAMIDPATDIMSTFRAKSGVATSASVQALALDIDGSVWAGNLREGLDRIDPDNGTIVRYRRADSELPDDHVQALLVDSHGTPWVGTWKGLMCRERGASHFTPGLSDASLQAQLSEQIVRSLHEGPDGRLWVGTQQGDLLIVETASGAARWIDHANSLDGGKRNAVSAAQTIGPNEVWLARANTVEVRDRDGRLIESLKHDWRKPWGIHGSDVRAIVRDQAGTVWLGGYGGGLQHYYPTPAAWVLRPDVREDAVLAAPDVRSILQLRNGEIWLGMAERGIAVLDRTLGAIGAVRPARAAAPGFAGSMVSALAQTGDGHVWAGTDAALYEFSEARELLSVRPTKFGRVRVMLAGADDRLWLGTRSGVYRLDRAPDGRPAAAPARVGELDGNINAILKAPDHAVIAGGARGVFRMPRASEGWQHIDGLPEAIHTTPDVQGMLFDAQQRLLVDTANGMYRMSALRGTQASFEAIGVREGFAGLSFGANLLADAHGRIWTQSKMYDPATGSFTKFGVADGVDVGTGWFRAFAKLADGRMLFGGAGGAQVIDPARFAPWTFQPPVVVSELRIDGERVPADLARAGLRLQPHQRSLSVEFAALDFSDPMSNAYRYHLQGYDGQWQERSAESRVASYSNLDPGRYVLQPAPAPGRARIEGARAHRNTRVRARGTAPSPGTAGPVGENGGARPADRRRGARDQHPDRRRQVQRQEHRRRAGPRAGSAAAPVRDARP
ncbi:MAG: two-component regulator propeller domain-containing protein [Pseudomonadota bacterium]